MGQVRMMNPRPVEILHPSRSVDLVCRFTMEHFDMFQNPIVWQKTQLDETTPINIMGNVMPPFVGTGRFKVHFEDSAPHYRIVLSIADLSLEDYGNYTCEVRGPQTSVLAKVTHYVYIRAPVNGISISDNKRTIHLSDANRILLFNESSGTSISCVSSGGCPPPEMEIYIGKALITKQFSTVKYTKVSGVKGLRIIEHVTESWTDDLHINSNYDEQTLQCIVTVPSLGSSIASVKLKVIYAPIIECNQTHASLGQRNVSLICIVRSRPSTTSLFWIIDGNGTTVSPGHMSHEYWTLNMARSDGKLETRLYIKHVAMEHFKTYSVSAENSIGKTIHELSLIQKYQFSSHQSVLHYSNGNTSHSPHRPRGSSGNSSHSCSLLIWLLLAAPLGINVWNQRHS